MLNHPENLSDTRHELFGFIKKIKRRIRWYDGIMLLQSSAWLAGLAGVLCLLAVRIFPFEGGNKWVLLPFILWLSGITLYSAGKPLPAMQAALRVDVSMGLKERISSSLDVGAHPEKRHSDCDDYATELFYKLHNDALQTIRRLDIHRVFIPQPQKRPLLSGLFMLLVCLVLLITPNPMDAILAERRAVKEEAQRQAEEIEELQTDIEESKELSGEEKEELLKKLSELARQLRNNPGDRQEALAQLSKLEEELRLQVDENDANRQAALESLMERLQELAGFENSVSPDNSALSAALNDVAALAKSQDEERRMDAAQSLSEMSSRAAQSGNTSLAQALAAMAEAVRSGDSQKASQAAASASQALAQASSKHALQVSVQKSLSQLQNSRQALSGQCQGGSQSQAGLSQGQSAGSGGGSRADVLPPFTGNSVNVQSPRGNKPVNNADLLNQSIYVPRMMGQNSGEELQIQGQDSGSGQEEVSGSPNPLPGLDNPSLVPYNQVYHDYADAANQALHQSYIPIELKNYVRSYFSQLEP